MYKFILIALMTAIFVWGCTDDDSSDSGSDSDTDGDTDSDTDSDSDSDSDTDSDTDSDSDADTPRASGPMKVNIVLYYRTQN